MTTPQIILVAVVVAVVALITLYTYYERDKYIRKLDKEQEDYLAKIEEERQAKMWANIQDQTAYENSLPQQDVLTPEDFAKYEKEVDDLCKYEAENTNTGTGDEWDFETPKPGKTEEL